MRAYAIGLTLGLLLAPAPAAMAQAITEEAAHAIGVDAYVYLYPMVTMEVTRRQATNIQAGKVFGRGPMNMFVNVPEFPPANFRDVVRSNFDTLSCHKNSGNAPLRFDKEVSPGRKNGNAHRYKERGARVHPPIKSIDQRRT
jgi:hypothetical protein